jgi:hypothetical protein
MARIKSFFVKRGRVFTRSLIIALSVVLIISLTGLVTSYNYPDQVVEEIPRAVISQRVDLSYVVLVRKSIIYDNRTVLQPGEVVYVKFLEGFNITYKLELSSSRGLGRVSGSYEVYVNISSPIWFKKIVVDSGDVGGLLGRAGSLYVNFTYLRDYISLVEREVGSSRAYTISVVFDARTNIELTNVSKSYAITSLSKLDIYYDTGKPFIDVKTSTPETKYVDSIKQVKPTEVSLILFSMNVITYRLLTMFSSITSAGLLALTLIAVTQGRSSGKPPITLLESKYRDLIISGELEQVKHVVAVIYVRDFRDLIKVATMRRKPIVKLGSEKTKFAVVDGDVAYVYREVAGSN